MIDYKEHFEFTNDVGSFAIDAYTVEHPSGYGNGSLLCMDVECDLPVERRRLFDVRYEGDDMAAIARHIMLSDYGVSV